MLGHYVRIVREGAEAIDGTLQSLQPEGAVVHPYGMPEQHQGVFVPMGRIVEIQDKGPVYR